MEIFPNDLRIACPNDLRLRAQTTLRLAISDLRLVKPSAPVPRLGAEILRPNSLIAREVAHMTRPLQDLLEGSCPLTPRPNNEVAA